MRITINLATRPFVELRPLFARLRAVMLALALLAVGLMFGLHAMTARAKTAQAQMDALKAQTTNFQMEKQRNEARMREPQNAAVLARSQFLNDLFAHKSFSWTAVMMDLEDVLPAGVQVTSIEPQISSEGDVTIHMKVGGDRERAVQLVRNLETSKRFLHPQVSSETMQSQQPGANGARPVETPGAVEFDILAGYNPLPAMVKTDTEKTDTRKTPTAKTDAAKAHTASAKGPAAKGGPR